MNKGYYTWFGVYALFVAMAVGFPVVAAMGLLPGGGNQICAGAGALSAALLHAIKPLQYATGYDAALQLAWKTRISLHAGEIDEIAASKQIAKAIDLTTFKYASQTALQL